MDDNRVRVFVSHHHSDEQFTSRLVTDLRCMGAEVWVDKDSIIAGDFRAAIDEGLVRSDRLVLVTTPAALASNNVREEVNAAKERAHRGLMRDVVFIMAAPCRDEEIPPTWAIIQRYDATIDYPGALDALVRALGLRGHIVDQEGNGHYRTIMDAVNQAQSGYKIVVRPGTYRESLRISKPITISGEGDRNGVIIELPPHGAIKADGGVKLTNLTIQGTPVHQPLQDGLVMASTDLSNPAEAVTIDNCVLHSSPRNGIVAELANVEVRGSAIAGCPGNAVLAGPSSRVHVSDCRLDAQVDAVYVGPRARVEVRGCQISSTAHAVWVRDGGEAIVEANDLRGCRAGPYKLDPRARVERLDNSE